MEIARATLAIGSAILIRGRASGKRPIAARGNEPRRRMSSWVVRLKRP